MTIFNKNQPGGTVVADFYTMALFDLDTGDYGTYTDYDMPPANMKPGAQRKLAMAAGHLDISYQSSAGTAVVDCVPWIATTSYCPTPIESAWWVRTIRGGPCGWTWS